MNKKGDVKLNKLIKYTILILLLLTATACGQKKDELKDEDQDKTPIEETLENRTDTEQGDLQLKDVKIVANGSINTVTATIKNTGKKTSTFDAVLYMKDDQSLVLGKVSGHINKLESGKSQDISIEIMGDYTTVKTFELVIENLVE